MKKGNDDVKKEKNEKDKIAVDSSRDVDMRDESLNSDPPLPTASVLRNMIDIVSSHQSPPSTSTLVAWNALQPHAHRLSRRGLDIFDVPSPVPPNTPARTKLKESLLGWKSLLVEEKEIYGRLLGQTTPHPWTDSLSDILTELAINNRQPVQYSGNLVGLLLAKMDLDKACFAADMDAVTTSKTRATVPKVLPLIQYQQGHLRYLVPDTTVHPSSGVDTTMIGVIQFSTSVWFSMSIQPLERTIFLYDWGISRTLDGGDRVDAKVSLAPQFLIRPYH